MEKEAFNSLLPKTIFCVIALSQSTIIIQGFVHPR